MEYSRSVYLNDPRALFFEKRIKLIVENKYPLSLPVDPATRLIVYLVPERYEEILINIKNLEKPENYFVSYCDSQESTIAEFNFDGILFHTNAHEKQAYTQVFRNGMIETVVAIAQFAADGKRKIISPLQIEKCLMKMLGNHLELLHKFHIPGPYSLYFHMLAVKDLRFCQTDFDKLKLESKGRNKVLVIDELKFLPYQLEYAEVNVKKALTPFLDILWNTFGFSCAP